MPKCHDKPINKKIGRLDFFIETPYTSNTASGIANLHKTTTFTCISCKEANVETTMKVKDTVLPTFVIYRKKYCTSCWLMLL